MTVVYPGLVNIDASTITVSTVNVYDDNQRTYTYDLTNQIPAWTPYPDLNSNEEIQAQAFLKNITLPSSARINTLMLILDGLTLSPQLSSGGPGDYRVLNSKEIELLWPEGQLPRMHSETDTPVLLARYTLA
jgi:hypothetical protein